MMCTWGGGFMCSVMVIRVPTNDDDDWMKLRNNSCNDNANLFNPQTHPRVSVRFGNTKSEIRVKKGVLTLFVNQPPHPPKFGKDLPKKVFFGWLPLLLWSTVYGFMVLDRLYDYGMHIVHCTVVRIYRRLAWCKIVSGPPRWVEHYS